MKFPLSGVKSEPEMEKIGSWSAPPPPAPPAPDPPVPAVPDPPVPAAPPPSSPHAPIARQSKRAGAIRKHLLVRGELRGQTTECIE